MPSGDWQIHFHYHAPYIEVSLAASIVGVVVIPVWVRTRRRRTSTRDG